MYVCIRITYEHNVPNPLLSTHTQLKQEVSGLRRAQQQRHEHAGANPIHNHDQPPIYAQGKSPRPVEALAAHDPALHCPNTSSNLVSCSTALARSASFPPPYSANLDTESSIHCGRRGADGLGTDLVPKEVDSLAMSPKRDFKGRKLDAHASHVHWENRSHTANAKIGEPLR